MLARWDKSALRQRARKSRVQTGRFFLPPTSGPAGPLILDHLDPPIRPAGALSPPHPAEFTVAAAHGEGAEPAAAARVTGPARQERPPVHPLGQPAAATLSRPRVHIGRVVTARRWGWWSPWPTTSPAASATSSGGTTSSATGRRSTRRPAG